MATPEYGLRAVLTRTYCQLPKLLIQKVACPFMTITQPAADYALHWFVLFVPLHTYTNTHSHAYIHNIILTIIMMLMLTQANRNIVVQRVT